MLIGHLLDFVASFDSELREANMDRRYYVMKASIFVLAVVIAVTCGALQAPRHPMQDAHYQAAVTMQATIHATEAKAAAALAHLFARVGRAAL
jgi:hypothetical protein